ncbi:ClpXP protease specificity-enhancing factor [Shewanella eurypsychrophilus]|uniref:ClpXP protease specificity-enhancing factor n=1 Tax=Shewanella eurypsychrophilus TaxID=2593656 RepID=A0ABX6VAG5_9GAMM|nr:MULTISPECIES: ClpXP protease specificity-enhancing factor [Shewanella]QFU24418.1 ClpXP protease specificity-enhancing factor [Shewanella sp. YLB-09]QPG59618.1 ClpXP protease specificity-enhancing factor [Shewanella eurypsychrophilus]
MKPMTPNRPYLLQAYYDWLMDNELTPHVVVDAYVPGTQVPQQYVKDGQIVLNITSSAVGNLQIGHDFIEFNARFGGVPQQVVLPMAAIVAIYARENGAGTVFDMEEAYEVGDESEEAGLSVVQPEVAETLDSTSDSAPVDTFVTDKVPEPKRRSHLTLVK